MESPREAPAAEHDDPVPVFKTWPRLYAAVLASAVLVMILIAVFSHWTF